MQKKISLLWYMVLGAMLFVSCATTPKIVQSDLPYNGIDISHYQGDVNWDKLTAKGNIEFVYIKATEGKTFVDKRHEEYGRDAAAHGLQVGYYHFFRPDVSGADQFANFEHAVRNLPQHLIPVLDIEVAPKAGNQQSFEYHIKTFIRLCKKRFGVEPILYCIPSFERKYLKAFPKQKKWYCGKIDDQADMKKCLLWQIAIREVPGIYGKVDWDFAPKVKKLKP